MTHSFAFIFPSNHLHLKQCDNHYVQEYEKIKSLGFDCFLIDPFDENSSLYPSVNNFHNKKFIYRGRVLRKEQYSHLYNSTLKNLKFSPKEYLNNHYLPNWYPHLKNYTFSTHILDDDMFESFFSENEGKTFLAKDYVKFLKTEELSIIKNFDEFKKFEKSVLKYKGFVEGGIVLSEFTNIQKETEAKLFVFNGEIFYPKSLLNMKYFEDFHSFAIQVKSHHNELFFSMDIVLDSNNNPKLVKIRDGQVSNYTGWQLDEFVKMFLTLKSHQT